MAKFWTDTDHLTSFTMAPTVKQDALSSIPSADLRSFKKYLKGSRRILGLLGAGISASSGLPTFRGAGGLWRSYDATSLATPEAFKANPGLVWQFYSYRRHMALEAKPNRAHLALADLARKNKDFITLSQNVDGLSERAEHPPTQLHLLHGSLFTTKCTSFYCDYVRKNDFKDPIVPALAIPQSSHPDPALGDTTGEDASKRLKEAMQKKDEALRSRKDIDISDAQIPIAEVKTSDLPHCPKCSGLLRPGVVWFGESLPSDTLAAVDEWIESEPVDLMLVIGTSSRVWPAAGYVDIARQHGARIAVINMDRNDMPGLDGLKEGDWFFQGDAGAIVPEILECIVGEIESYQAVSKHQSDHSEVETKSKESVTESAACESEADECSDDEPPSELEQGKLDAAEPEFESKRDEPGVADLKRNRLGATEPEAKSEQDNPEATEPARKKVKRAHTKSRT